MGAERSIPELRGPSYVIGTDGQATAVLVDIDTWRTIVGRLEDAEDYGILKTALADLTHLAQGRQPPGWKSWEELEEEWDRQGDGSALPA